MLRPGTLVLFLLLAAAPAENAAQTSTARVIGRVVDLATGEPISGARVTLLRIAPSAGPRPSTLPAMSARPIGGETNTDGVFLVVDIPPGRWRVQVEKTGFSRVVAPIIEVAAGSVTVPDIRLDRGGVITGRVVGANGTPLSDVPVAALSQTRSASGALLSGQNSVTEQTNDLGEFRLSGVPPGDYIVVARPRPVSPLLGAPTPSATTYLQTVYPGVTDPALAALVRVTRGGTTAGIDFQMIVEAAYQVSGVVVDESGRPAPGAVVRLSPVAGTALAAGLTVTAAADGTFRIVNVPLGTYRIQAAIPLTVRTERGASTSVSFGAPGRGAVLPEIFVTGTNVTGIQVVARR